jgi:hypothetical protein
MREGKEGREDEGEGRHVLVGQLAPLERLHGGRSCFAGNVGAEVQGGQFLGGEQGVTALEATFEGPQEGLHPVFGHLFHVPQRAGDVVPRDDGLAEPPDLHPVQRHAEQLAVHLPGHVGEIVEGVQVRRQNFGHVRLTQLELP